MKKVIYKIIYICLCAIALIILSDVTVKAASASLTATPTEPKEGESVTVSANVTAGAWNLQLSGNGKSETIYGYTQSNSNASDSKSITFTAGSAGTTYTFTLIGDMTDITAENSESVNKSITINVAKTTQNSGSNTNQGGTTTPAPEPQPEPQAPVKQEPNFKNANKTMYAEKDINLRESWSTSSKATSIDGGTELKVTAISTNKVNDYIWYKVSYNGKTYYVASNLLTDTKPEEKPVQEPTQEPVEEPEPEEQAEIGEEPIINEEAEEHALSGLDILEIEGQTLSPKFKWNTYEYRVIVNDDISELNIKTRTVAKSGKAVIAGNKDLQEGENLITIVVYDVDGKVEATYQITVNKNTADLSGADKLLKNGNSEATRNLIIFLVLLVIAIIGLIVVIILKRKKQIIDEDYEDYEENYEEYVVQSTENEQIVENSSEEIHPEETEMENLEGEPQPRRKREKRKGKHF